MADWLSRVGTCVVHGTVILPGEGDEAGVLKLNYKEKSNVYRINVSKTAGGDELVCEFLMFLLFHFQECNEKIKTLLIKKPKFHSVQYLKQMVPCTEARE